MSSSSRFTGGGVREYEKRRYRGLDQRIVHARETKIIRKMLAEAAKDAAGRDGMRRVLDMPCGYGRFTAMLRDRGLEVVGADLSLEMARRAAENTAGGAPEEGGAGRGIPVLAADARRLPFRAGAFDLVFSIRLFHHIHSPESREAILGEFSRVSSAYALVSFYRANGLHEVQRRLRRAFGKSRTNIKMVEPGVFEKAAGEAGFSVVRVLPLFGGIHAYHLALLKKRTAD